MPPSPMFYEKNVLFLFIINFNFKFILVVTPPLYIVLFACSLCKSYYIKWL